MSAADRGGRVAPPPTDPSEATGRVKRRDNQLHRARVLEEDAMGRAGELATSAELFRSGDALVASRRRRHPRCEIGGFSPGEIFGRVFGR